MRINTNAIEGGHFYAGKCKGNTAPKHVTGYGVERKKVKLDGKSATMFDSPKTDYIYIKSGDNWLWVKDKSILGLDDLNSMPVTRATKPVAEADGQTDEITVQ